MDKVFAPIVAYRWKGGNTDNVKPGDDVSAETSFAVLFCINWLGCW